MNKASFERAMKAAAQGKPLKEVKVITGEGDVYDVTKILYDSVTEVIYIDVELVDED